MDSYSNQQNSNNLEDRVSRIVPSSSGESERISKYEKTNHSHDKSLHVHQHPIGHAHLTHVSDKPLSGPGYTSDKPWPVHEQRVNTPGSEQTDALIPPSGAAYTPGPTHVHHDKNFDKNYPVGQIGNPTGLPSQSVHVHDEKIYSPTGQVIEKNYSTGHTVVPKTGTVQHEEHVRKDKLHPTIQPTHALENEKIRVDKHDQYELQKHDKSPRKNSTKSPRNKKSHSKSPSRDKHATIYDDRPVVVEKTHSVDVEHKRKISTEERHRKVSGDKHKTQVVTNENDHKVVVEQKVDERFSGEQELYRKKQALDILRQLQILATSYAVEGGQKPGATNLLTDVLDKAEELLARQAAQPATEIDVRRTLEDLSAMVGSLKQLTRHKDIGDRIQSITENTKRAVEATQAPDMTNSNRRVSEESILLLESWKPVFNLLISSREFRELINDTIQISRKVFVRHHEGLGTTAGDRFVSGVPVTDIGKMVTDHSSSTFKDEEGKIRLQMSEEEYEIIIDDLLRNLKLLQSNRNFKDGFSRLLNLGSLYRNQLRSSKDYMNNESTEKHARRALKETQGLIATFTGRETLDNLYRSFTRLMKRVDEDAEARLYLHEIKEFLLKEEIGAYSDSDLRRIIRSFIQRGRDLSNNYRYAEELEDLLDDVEEAMENIKNDEFVRVLRHNAGLVASDLSYVDNEGRVQVDMEMISKLRDTIAPYIAEFLKYIPIPRMEGSDSTKTYWVDDIVLCAYDIVPENVRFEIESSADFSVRDIETKQADTKLVVRLKNIRTELKDLEFYFKRLTFPEMSEHGRVSVKLGGEGAAAVMTFRVYQDINDAFPRFVDGRADFSISKLDIVFDKTTLKHNVLVPMVMSMMKSQIKKQIEVEVEKNLSKLLNSVGDKLTDALAQINRPLLGSIGTIRTAMKGTGMSQVYERRREKLE